LPDGTKIAYNGYIHYEAFSSITVSVIQAARIKRRNRKMLSTYLVSIAAVLAGPGAPAVSPELAPGVKILAGDKTIDVEVGHAAPHFADFDGDGVRDLLVGQFGGGKLRIYRNTGDNAKPKFGAFNFFQADGKDATVPYG
jgi:hypothetical protein